MSNIKENKKEKSIENKIVINQIIGTLEMVIGVLYFVYMHFSNYSISNNNIYDLFMKYNWNINMSAINIMSIIFSYVVLIFTSFVFYATICDNKKLIKEHLK